jgi:hypothetical protein
VLVFVIGAILVPGRRTVASALRVVGLSQARHFTNYRRVLNRNAWSAHDLSRRLLVSLVDAFVLDGEPVVMEIVQIYGEMVRSSSIPGSRGSRAGGETGMAGEAGGRAGARRGDGN